MDLSSGWEIAGSIEGGLTGHNTTRGELDGHAQVGITGVGAGTYGWTEGGVDQEGNLAGAAQGMYRPGAIVDMPMDQILLVHVPNGFAAKISLQGIHVKIDSCGGPVKLRSYAVLRVHTLDEHFTIATYGKVFFIKKN